MCSLYTFFAIMQKNYEKPISYNYVLNSKLTSPEIKYHKFVTLPAQFYTHLRQIHQNIKLLLQSKCLASEIINEKTINLLSNL